jgi:hypothetical protein
LLDRSRVEIISCDLLSTSFKRKTLFNSK